MHLLGRVGAVDLTDAEFLRRSIVTHSASELSIPKRNDPGEPPEDFPELSPAEQARWTAKKAAFQLVQRLEEKLGSEDVGQTRAVSLCRATVGDLVLSGINLENCAFAGAHGLDKVRIDATCTFRIGSIEIADHQRPPARSGRTWPPFTRRRVIYEEAQWRETHTPGWPAASTTDAAVPGRAVPTALEIAGIYRDLRKGLEDSKDEPGAADFYYGEMEMRRLAARRRRHQSNNDGNAIVPRSSWAERRLLDAYWTTSGYGLRAWRALTALTLLLVTCAALFTMPVFAHLPDPPQQVSSVDLRTGDFRYAPSTKRGVNPNHSAAIPLGTALEFSARESLTLTRTPGTPILQTTGAGTALDIALRLLAPLLVGLAILAVRGRTKR